MSSSADTAECVVTAAKCDSWDLVEWLHENEGFPLSAPLFEFANAQNNQARRAWLRDNQCPTPTVEEEEVEEAPSIVRQQEAREEAEDFLSDSEFDSVDRE